MNAYLHPRDEIMQSMERIYRYRMTTTSGGNLSIREDSGDIWITPARLDIIGVRHSRFEWGWVLRNKEFKTWLALGVLFGLLALRTLV